VDGHSRGQKTNTENSKWPLIVQKAGLKVSSGARRI